MSNGFLMENLLQMVFDFIQEFLRIYVVCFSSDDHLEIRAKGSVHTLTIHKVAWNEGGEYKCVADGGAKTSATLIVKGKLQF